MSSELQKSQCNFEDADLWTAIEKVKKNMLTTGAVVLLGIENETNQTIYRCMPKDHTFR